jgi:hypothetical protein
MRAALALLLALLLVAALPGPGGRAGPPARKRIALLVDSWYPWSHADVIGMRILEGYRLGDRRVASPLTIAAVYAEAPRPDDRARALAARYGFRLASSIADALLEHGRLAVDGVVLAPRINPPEGQEVPSPTPRLRAVREVFSLFERTGKRVPVFLDKLVAENWADSRAIVAEARWLGVPLMGGSVLGYAPLDRPVRPGKVEVAVAAASTPYWAFAFHAMEMLQAYLERRGPRETGVRSVREVGAGYWSLPERERWGVPILQRLIGEARTRKPRGPADTRAVLVEYVDGTRAALVLVGEAFDDAEFLLGARLADGTVTTGGLVLPGEPFDHFGYLVHALAEFFTTGKPPVPVERSLLTTGVVLQWERSRLSGRLVEDPSLAIAYPTR